MKILLLGAAGFIGRHLLSHLLSAGHQVTGIARNDNGIDAAFPDAVFHSLNLARMTNSADWIGYLDDIDIVINAAGILRGPDMQAIHLDMPTALHTACEQMGVRQVILISAISARADVATDYSQSKLAGEASLKQTSLCWTILRPSLVYGDGSYGGTSLMRGMSGLPGFIPIPGDGNYSFTPIHVRDLAKSVTILCGRNTTDNITLEPVGPTTISLRDLLIHYRSWLNFGEPWLLKIPMPVMHLFGRIGDFAGHGPIASNSLIQMVAGNSGNSVKFEKEIGFRPRSLSEALLRRPAQVQDRWHARLFFIAPVLKAALVLLWIASAFLGLLFGEAQTITLLDRFNLPHSLAWPLQIITSLLDLTIAALLLFARDTKWPTIIQLVTVLGYTVVIGIALPMLWLDPLGPLLKNLPIITAILVYGAIGSNR